MLFFEAVAIEVLLLFFFSYYSEGCSIAILLRSIETR